MNAAVGQNINNNRWMTITIRYVSPVFFVINIAPRTICRDDIEFLVLLHPQCSELVSLTKKGFKSINFNNCVPSLKLPFYRSKLQLSSLSFSKA